MLKTAHVRPKKIYITMTLSFAKTQMYVQYIISFSSLTFKELFLPSIFKGKKMLDNVEKNTSFLEKKASDCGLLLIKVGV